MSTAPGPGAVVPAAGSGALCQDCGAPISGNYCSNCGQETKIETPTVRQFAHELIDQYIAVEGKLGRTLRVLLTQPGQLTLDYLQGRRQRYVRPLKLYVSVSVVFFGLLGILPDSIGNPFMQADRTSPRPAADAAVNGSTAQSAKAAAVPARQEQALDLRQQIQKEIQDDLDKEKDKDGDDDDAGRRIARKNGADDKRAPGLSSPEQRKELREKLADDAPYAMFFLLPFFALLLRFLYRKSQQRYGMHLLFTVHLHCFFFLLLMLMFLPLSPLRKALELTGAVYTFLALRRVYGGGWARTLWRMSLLALVDMMAISATTLSGVMTAVFGGSP